MTQKEPLHAELRVMLNFLSSVKVYVCGNIAKCFTAKWAVVAILYAIY